MRNIKDLSFEELGNWFIEYQEKPYRTQQVFSWLYQEAISDFDEMTDLSIKLRKQLKDNFELDCLSHRDKRLVSDIDKTEKYLLRLKDGYSIETVVMPYQRRCTICLSSQVGCRFHCVFCASGKRGLMRNLSAGEILEQVVIAKREGHNVTHIVFMGMGEPLDNFDNVIRAIKIFNHPDAFCIGARRITISTSGIPEGIDKLISLNLQIELSVSLHSAIDEVRCRLMPINKKYPLSVLMQTLKEYIQKTNRQITFEYVLIDGVNSSAQDALLLAKLLQGVNCKVNLIPFNVSNVVSRHPQSRLGGTVGQYQPVSFIQAKRFQDKLKASGVKTTIRHSRGADIQAACGQLTMEGSK
jgi:23S rRNA (adenine2503-C2)-methyltransferase